MLVGHWPRLADKEKSESKGRKFRHYARVLDISRFADADDFHARRL